MLTGFLLSVIQLDAQNSSYQKGFNAELLFGLNFSQLDGDRLSGFNKAGIRTGLQIGVPVTERNDISLGILFDQRGSRNNIFGTGFNQHISLDYISFPLSLSHKSWMFEDMNRYKIRVYGSIIPARLFKIRSSHPDFNNATEKFKKWDLSIAVRLAYAIGTRSSLQLRLERSILKMYSIPNSNITGLQSYLISVQVGYILNHID